MCTSTDFATTTWSSALFEVDEHAPEGPRTFVVDTGPDFRQQMLRSKVTTLDAVLFTHEHKDHVAGLDDIRAFNFRQKRDMDVYAVPRVQEALRREFKYVFDPHPYPGIPKVQLHDLDGGPVTIGGVEVMPLPVVHYKLPVLGFRIGPIAYITDANAFAPETWPRLEGVEVLVINALRKEPHLSHFTLGEALEVIERWASEAYLTHISHLLGKHRRGIDLPRGVFLGEDGLHFRCMTRLLHTLFWARSAGCPIGCSIRLRMDSPPCCGGPATARRWCWPTSRESSRRK